MDEDYFQDISPSRSPRSVKTASDQQDLDALGSVQPSGKVPSINNTASRDFVSDGIKRPMREPGANSIRTINIDQHAPRSYQPEVLSARPLRRINTRSRSPLRWILWGTGVALLIAGVLGYGYFASKPTIVTVTPRTETLDFSATPVHLDAIGAASGTATSTTGGLTYTLVTKEFTQSADIVVTGTATVSAKATGRITVYNTTPKSVSLTTNTRFATASGLVFRTPAAIVIPAGSTKQPGSVTVTVVADANGPQYNISSGKLTLPGLKGSSLASSVYASVAQPFTGGSGSEKGGISAEQRAQALEGLQNTLSTMAGSEVLMLADTQMRVPGLYSITYEHAPDIVIATSTVRITEKAKVQYPVFNTTQFTTALLVAAGQPVPTTPVVINSVGFAGKLTGTSTIISEKGIVPFDMQGVVGMHWNVDPILLAQALATTPKAATSFNAIIAKFDGIETAHASVQPWWNQTFPADPKVIKILIASSTPQNR